MVEVEAGESVVIKARAVDPITKHIITDASGSAHAWCEDYPSPVPVGIITTRLATLEFDKVSRYYLGTLDTTGFCKGLWLIQVYVEGGEAGYRSIGRTKVTVK